MKFNKKFRKKKWVNYTIATCSAVVLFVILTNLGNILGAVGSFFSFVRPVILGIAIAYVVNPLGKWLDSKVLKNIKSDASRWKTAASLTLVIIVAAVVLLGMALIPQLADSVATLASNMDSYIESFEELLKDLENTRIGFVTLDLSFLANLGDTLLGYLKNYFSNNATDLVETSANAGKSLFDFVLALILAVYFLFDKNRIIDGLTKFFSLIMKEDSYEKTGNYLSRCNDITIRYIGVDVLDGIIVGVANFLCMVVAGVPYAVLISVIAALTNLAPTFGPLVGAVIGGFILVLVKPWYALLFLIFTVIIQTIDGYVLKPRLFGGSLGIPSLMIMIAIILGGRLMGVLGILLAIPVAAIIDFTYKDYLLKRLEQRKEKDYNS